MNAGPACNRACTAGEDVREWLYLARESDGADGWYQAWRALTTRNPLPAVAGFVCYRRCEEACIQHPSVAIGDIERFLGVEAINRCWPLDAPASDTGKHVLIVGSGPAGLAAAHEVRRAGHKVTVHEGLTLTGGLMRSAIPVSRLPRFILDAEIERLQATGVRIEVNQPTRLTAETLACYDAAVHCGGAASALALVADTVLWRQPLHTTSYYREDRTVSYAISQGRQAASAVNTHLASLVSDEPPAVPIHARELHWMDSSADPGIDLKQVRTELNRCRICGWRNRHPQQQ